MRSLHLALLLLLRACLVPKAAHGRLVPIWIYRAPPTSSPTSSPSYEPSSRPSSKPTVNPSSLPSSHPSHRPSSQPTSSPSYQPSYHPSSSPSSKPTSNPTSSPSSQPSYRPSSKPTSSPSISPSSFPSYRPSSHPTSSPSHQPSDLPSYSPSSKPTSNPSCSPSNHPSLRPSSKPTSRPSISPSDHPSLRPSSQPTSQPISQPSSSPSFSPSYSSQPSFSAQPSSEQSSNPPSSLRVSNNLATPGGIPVPSSLGFWLSVGIMALLIFFITSQFAQKAKKRKSGGGDQDVPDNLDEMIDNQLVTYVVQVAQPTPPTPTPPTPTPTPPKRKEVEKKKQKKKRRDGEGEKVRDSKVKEHRHRDSRRPEVQKESSKGRNNDDLWKMHVPDVSKLWNDQNDKNRDALPRRDSYRERDSNDGQDVAVKRNRIIDCKPSRDRRPDDIGDDKKRKGRGRSADRYSERGPSPPRNIEDDYDQSSATKTHLSEGERTWFSMFTPARNENESEDDWRKRTRSSDHKVSRDRRPDDIGDDRKRRGRGRSADLYSEREPSPPRNIEDEYDQSSATKTHLSEDERTWFSMFTPARNENESEDDWRKRTRDHKDSRDRRADDHDGRRRGRGRSADRYSQREPSPPRNNEDDYDQSSATKTHLSEDERTWFSMFTPARNDDESEDDWRKRTRDHKVSRGRRADDHDGRRRGRSADRYSEREPSPLKKTHRSKGERTWFHRFNRNKSEKLSRDRRLDDLDNRRRGRGTDRYHEREPSPPRNFDDDSDQSSASKTHRSEGDRTWFSVFTPARNEDEDDSASPSSFDSCSQDESSSSGSYPSLASM